MRPQAATIDIDLTRRSRKESPLGLYIAVIRDRADAPEQLQKLAFRSLILDDGYEDFLGPLIDEWASIKYGIAKAAALPPNVRQLKAAVAKRKQAIAKEDDAVKRVKRAIGERMMELVTMNGKKLGDCTAADCKSLGGFYAAIGNAVPTGKTVRKVLSTSEIAVMAADWKIAAKTAR